MVLPSIAQILKAEPPVFVRKLDRKRDWGTDDLPIEDRVGAIVKKFQEDDSYPRLSFFLVDSMDVLRRVAIALNRNRGSLTEVLELLAFHPDEFQAVEIALQRTPGNTLCHFANLVHYELPESATQFGLEALCRRAMEARRIPGRCTEGTMRTIVPVAQAEQCLAAMEPSPGCLVPACSSAAQVFSSAPSASSS